jgi:hypothetical protein
MSGRPPNVNITHSSSASLSTNSEDLMIFLAAGRARGRLKGNECTSRQDPE